MTRTERRRRQQRRRMAAMQRAACLALALLAVAAAFAWSGRTQEPETPEATVPVTATALPAETPTLEPITLEFEDQEAIDPMEASKVALAKMVWGEARGCSTTEQAATIWCVLNRYDSGDRFWADTVEGITTQPCQFYGYDPQQPGGPGHPGPGGGCAGPLDGREGVRRQRGPGAAEGVPVLHRRRRTQLLHHGMARRADLGLVPGKPV